MQINFLNTKERISIDGSIEYHFKWFSSIKRYFGKFCLIFSFLFPKIKERRRNFFLGLGFRVSQIQTDFIIFRFVLIKYQKYFFIYFLAKFKKKIKKEK